MYKRSLTLIAIIAFSCLVNFATSQVVCSQDELIKELYEDLIDNGINFKLSKGKLDCLRKSVSPNEVDETDEQRKRRIEAEWDSDCAFEAVNTGIYNFYSKETLTGLPNF